MQIFVNGNSLVTSTVTASYVDGITTICGDAIRGTTWSFNGYTSDIRVTNGVARYTTNFTPPDSAPTQ